MTPVKAPLFRKPRFVSPHKTGSKSGELNFADRVWVRIRYVGAFVWTLLVGIAGYVEAYLPSMQGTWPVWALMILGGLAAAIVRFDTGNLQRNASNLPAPPISPPVAPPPDPPSPPAV